MPTERPALNGLSADEGVSPWAPVRGAELRCELPREYFQRAPWRFVLKFVLAFALVASGFAAFAFDAPLVLKAAAFVLNALMFAHLVELQHECLHGHPFRSPAINRIFGVACGLFMLSSYSHYRYHHLRHHAFLGTERNREHFDYRFENLDSVLGFARAFFDLSRYLAVGEALWRAATGQPQSRVDKDSYQRAIRHEYVLYALIAVAATAWSVWAGSALLLWAWALPVLLISEGVHFMIEIPEHFGLNTQTDANVLTNTRTVRTSALVSWFVNGNDLHTAHHFHQGVPMCNVRRVHGLIEDRIGIVERSYVDFYRRVLAGAVQRSGAACCTAR
jgi:fatty acid desaturase